MCKILINIVFVLILLIPIISNGYGEDREPFVSGTFYPADPQQLKRLIGDYLNKANPKAEKEAKLFGFISPHAGYIYSAQVASFGYKLLKGKNYNEIIILAPSHRLAFRGVSIYNKGDYITPLGKVKVDIEKANSIINESELIRFIPEAHRYEHSLEVQLPLLQSVVNNFSIIPIIMGDYSMETCKKISDILYKSFKDENVVFIASSDMSHYHSYKEAVEMDKACLDKIKNFDISALVEGLESGEFELCGRGPVITLMLLAEKFGARKVSILNYANSGDVTGDKSRVVGYGSVAFWLKENKQSVAEYANTEFLTLENKYSLLDIARRSIIHYLKYRNYPNFKFTQPQLNMHRGVFVTLKKNGKLRGCIGSFRTDLPLYKLISMIAISSAVRDLRFMPVTLDEMDEIEIEISVLSPLKQIKNEEEINLGKDGIYIVKGNRSGCFLPQVASETGWSKSEFLEHCAVDKAGLSSATWRDGAKIYTFQAEVFSESEISPH